MVRVVLHVPAAAAAATRGVTYRGWRIRGAGGQPGGGGGALGGRRGGGGEAFSVAEVPLTLAHQRLVVALHPLQLLLCGHAASGLTAGRLHALCRRGKTLQGTLGSLLVRRGQRKDTGIEVRTKTRSGCV